MPELPEVETIVRTLRPHVLQRKVSQVRLQRRESLEPSSLPLEQLCGSTCTAVSRRGKLILFGFDSGLTLAVHLRMTGALLVQDHIAPGRYCRCIFTLQESTGKTSWLFFDDIRCFGTLLLTDQKGLGAFPYLATLGPEPLSLQFSDFVSILSLHKEAQIKAVLLNQRVIAGIGNIYADESLFSARLLPTRSVKSLHTNEYRALYTSITEVLNKALAQMGTSFRNYQDANGHPGRFQNTLAVYGKAGQPCPRCGSPLQKSRVAGRGTVFCSNCQH